MTFREEMMHEMKVKIQRQQHMIAAQWWIIGLLAFAVACLAL